MAGTGVTDDRPLVPAYARANRWLGPALVLWPDGAVAWCQTCDRPIMLGQPSMPRIPFVNGWAGFVHQHCPPKLRVVR